MVMDQEELDREELDREELEQEELDQEVSGPARSAQAVVDWESYLEVLGPVRQIWLVEILIICRAKSSKISIVLLLI